MIRRQILMIGLTVSELVANIIVGRMRGIEIHAKQHDTPYDCGIVIRSKVSYASNYDGGISNMLEFLPKNKCPEYSSDFC